ncbi:MAG: hypothetical protein ACFHXK_06625 [bacterium]
MKIKAKLCSADKPNEITLMRIMLLVAGLLLANVCFASDASIIMAEIVIDLNHFPSDDDKSYLTEISEDAESSSDEKALAAIIGRIMHKPAADDVATLESMIRSGEATEYVKTLAKAILSIEHKPSAEAIAELERLLDE